MLTPIVVIGAGEQVVLMPVLSQRRRPPQRLMAEKEEVVLPQDRPACGGAKLIVPVRWLRAAVLFVDRATTVEAPVTEELVRRSSKRVAARPCHDVERRGGGAANLRWRAVGFESKPLDRCLTQLIRDPVRTVASQRLAREAARVIEPVDDEAILIAREVHDAEAAERGLLRDRGRKLRKTQIALPQHGKIPQLGFGDEGARMRAG